MVKITIATPTSFCDLKSVQSYLYQLSEQLNIILGDVPDGAETRDSAAKVAESVLELSRRLDECQRRINRIEQQLSLIINDI